MSIKNILGKKIIFFDGAMGTVLQQKGLAVGELPELYNINHPDIILDIYIEYLQAGSDMLTTNTFGANALKFEKTVLEKIIAKSISIAKEAIGKQNKFVAYDMSSTGKLLAPLGDLPFERAYALFKQQAVWAQEYGADAILIETMSCAYEMKAAVLAVKENTNLPLFATMTFDEKGFSLTGADVVCMASLLEGLGVDALGINCGLGPKQIVSLLDTLMPVVSTPVMIQPNAGLPEVINGETIYNIDSEEFSNYMQKAVEKGVWIVGGCCGTTPVHIEKTVLKCKDIRPKEITEKNITMVSSGSQTVILGDAPIIIGERINPTGKKKFKQALLNNDRKYMIREAVAQRDAGAHVLDVNVGLPEIDEKSVLEAAILTIQENVHTPLQIDSSSKEAIEAALRIYNGKPIVNSVNGKQEVMNDIFPLIKKYGGVVIGLTLDENGIPPLAEDRLAIGANIVKEAQRHGIHKKNVIIDPLVLTVSAQQKEAFETIKALRLIKEKLGLKTVLGVSNISFGLPNRELINTAFLAMALANGLDACIMNPLSSGMLDVYNAFAILSNVDKDCVRYIARYKEENTKTENITVVSPEPALQEVIVRGLKSEAFHVTENLLKTIEPLTVIDGHIIPALKRVGDDFESSKLFLPQLLASAEAAKNSFEAINHVLQSRGHTAEKKGKILLATVKGDIHDIGKNIVKAILENYGYEVMDLGKDVPIEHIVETVKKENIKLVGLSALMTATVANMKLTIEALRQKCDCLVMVGGAVLTQEYADKIGADFYGKDAVQAAQYAEKVIKKMVVC